MRNLSIIFALLFATKIFAATPYTIALYGDGMKPNDNGYVAADEVDKNGKIYKTSEPRMDIYFPKSGTPTAIILSCPGGGYTFTSIPNEGVAVANFFTARNMVVAVLKYRVPNMHKDVPLSDAAKALEILRDSASVWGVPTNRIGVIGFSAGGHLAATLVTKFPTQKSRPDFGILVYPVISMDESITHKGSCFQLLGENPTLEQRLAWSADECVTNNTPPCFIVHCQDDKTVMVENSIRMYQALTKHKVKAEMILLPTGAHGWGFSKQIAQKEVFESAMMKFIYQNL